MRYPVIEPFDSGVLEAASGHLVFWERVGNPHGKPAVVLHGGPGSGAQPWWRTYFDPDRYSVTLFDQRGCRRSRPLASEPDIDLGAITMQYLIEDIEALPLRAMIRSPQPHSRTYADAGESDVAQL